MKMKSFVQVAAYSKIKLFGEKEFQAWWQVETKIGYKNIEFASDQMWKMYLNDKGGKGY